jgi:hypothetical protein
VTVVLLRDFFFAQAVMGMMMSMPLLQHAGSGINRRLHREFRPRHAGWFAI